MVSKSVSDASDKLLPALEARVAASGRTWIIPFTGLAVVVVVITGIAWVRYKKLLKTHFL